MNLLFLMKQRKGETFVGMNEWSYMGAIGGVSEEFPIKVKLNHKT